ncbi:MAG: hypothetical protein ACK501_15265 [Planctomycetota bacterium]|jgi:hypothetical protein
MSTTPSAAEKPRSWVGTALLLMLGSAVVGGLPVWMLLYMAGDKPEGEPLDVARARTLVVEKAVLLTELRQLQANVRKGDRAPREQELLRLLGALAVTAPDDAGGAVHVVFRRFGEPGSSHEQRLEWLPTAAAASRRATALGAGELREELVDGWWWVQR